MMADYKKYTGICIRKKILEQDFWFRWLVFAGGALSILIFGIWGSQYDAKALSIFSFKTFKTVQEDICRWMDAEQAQGRPGKRGGQAIEGPYRS